jgi:ATP-dependent protease HslVU (ClpYQ) ATPase subunit
VARRDVENVIGRKSDASRARLKERVAPAVSRLIGAIGISRCDLHREIARFADYPTIKTFRASSAIAGPRINDKL